MEFRVDGVIEFHPGNKYKLKEPLNFSSPSGARVALSSSKDNDLSVEITLEADNVENAKSLAAVELDRIANLLSYSREIPIKESRTGGVAYEQLDTKGELTMIIQSVVRLHGEVSTVLEFGPKTAEQLGRLLEKEYLPDFHDVTSMYRQAISIEEPALRYMLLYRLMEFLFEGPERNKQLTAWVIKEEPSVEVYDDIKRGKHTIYTYLRDSVHPKAKLFPYSQIESILLQFQSLVKKRIKEKFGVGYP